MFSFLSLNVLLWGLGSFVTLIVLLNTFIIVGGRELASLERRWFGKKLPQGRVIGMADEVGVQARTLGPGFHALIPFLYKTKKCPFTVIGETEVGLIESIDGNPVEPGKIFAKVVEGHGAFQDGEAFLTNGGEKGPQIGILPPGNYRINPFLFKVRNTKNWNIDKGYVGLVTARDGEAISGRLLAKKILGHNNFENGALFLAKGGQKGPQAEILQPGTYRINTDLFNVESFQATVIPSGNVGLVTALDGLPLPEGEYVAKSITGHNDYQDVAAFLENGGQRGPQFDVLKPGTYYINPLMFKVELDKVAIVERGQVAVLVSNVGEEPQHIKDLIDADNKVVSDSNDPSKVKDAEDRLRHGIERYVVPKGYRGIQQEVAGPGVYYLNRRAYIAYVIDTTNITIDWDSDAKETKFDALKVVSKDGFEIYVSVKVIIRVRPDQAPYMVSKIGSIDNLINHVIHPMIDSSFRNQASSTSAMNFMQDRQDEQRKAEERTKSELEKYHVECVSVLICQIKLPQELMDTQTNRIIAQQQCEMYSDQQKAQVSRISTEKTRAEAELQSKLVDAEIGVKIAAQNKQKVILSAQGDAESTALKAEGEARGITAIGKAQGSKILDIGTATATSYDLQNKSIGAQGVTSIEIFKQIASGAVKITPDLLVNGGGENGGSGGLINLLLAKMLQDGKTPVITTAENVKTEVKTETKTDETKKS